MVFDRRPEPGRRGYAMREKVQFTKEKETLLLTFECKARQSRTKNPILPDPWAEAAVAAIDWNGRGRTRGPFDTYRIALRARMFDRLTTEFLAEHSNAVVLHLGCGLDSRVYRVDPPKTVDWFDVDYPDVVELRRRIYFDRPGYQTVGTSLADVGWLADVPTGRPVLVLAEGVTMYLTEETVRRLLNELADRFGDVSIVFDAHSRRLIRWTRKHRSSVAGTGATFEWGLDAPGELSTLDFRYENVATYRAQEAAEYARLPRRVKFLTWLTERIPAFRGLNRVWHFRSNAG
jgi:O-methyltransferase involved in polyketide biosynthesis